MRYPLPIMAREIWLRIRDWVESHQWTCIILCSVGLLYWMFGGSDEPKKEPARAPQAVAVQLPASPGEDGTALHEQFSNEQAILYWSRFTQVMESAVAGKPVPWEAKVFSLQFTPGSVALSKSKNRCRPFNETLRYHGETASNSGIACKTPDGQWCRRFSSETKPTCRVQPVGGLEGFMLDSDISMRNFGIRMNRTMGNIGRWF